MTFWVAKLAQIFGIPRTPSVLLERDEGQTFVEYALILSVIGIGMVLVLRMLGSQLFNYYSYIEVSVRSAL